MQACVICHGQSYQQTVVQWLPLAPPTECPITLSFQLRLKEEELRDYQRAEDEALTKRQLLEQALKDLEYELEAKSHLKDDRSRLIKQMEVCWVHRQEPGCGAPVWATGECFLCGRSRGFLPLSSLTF